MTPATGDKIPGGDLRYNLTRCWHVCCRSVFRIRSGWLPPLGARSCAAQAGDWLSLLSRSRRRYYLGPSSPWRSGALFDQGAFQSTDFARPAASVRRVRGVSSSFPLASPGGSAMVEAMAEAMVDYLEVGFGPTLDSQLIARLAEGRGKTVPGRAGRPPPLIPKRRSQRPIPISAPADEAVVPGCRLGRWR